MDRPSPTPGPSSLTTASQAGMSDHPLSPHTHPGSSLNRRPSSFVSSPNTRRPSPSPIASQPDYFSTQSDLKVDIRGDGESIATTDELLGFGTVSPTRLGGSSRSSPKKRAGKVGSSGYGGELEGMSEREMEVIRIRWDKMGDEEINKVISEWRENGVNGSIPIKDNQPPSYLMDSSTIASSTASTGVTSLPIPISAPSDQPLFPPSPPPISIPFIHRPTEILPGRKGLDHPLRILARAVLELQETVSRLRRENERLRAELEGGTEGGMTVRGRKGVDAASLHDGLSEAISTSLTSPPILSVQSVHSGQLPHPPRVPSPAPSTSSRRSHQSRAKSPTSSIYQSIPTGLAPSNRSIRSVDSRQADIPLPSNRSVRSMDLATRQYSTASPGPSSKKREARSSWTASLWGWGGSSGSSGKRGMQRDRKGSVSSSLREEIRQAEYENQNGQEGQEKDEEGWRKRDGGSSPGYKAIFLATRLLTPDPLSILSPSHIQPNSLLAYLAHSLVSTARDEGIAIKEPPNSRRRASRETRSRAVSIASQESQYPTSNRDNGQMPNGGKDKTYTDTLVASTASYGRSFFSSVSGSTIRGTRSKAATNSTTVEETIRPSLLSRTSARTFPTTAITPTTTSNPSGNSSDDQPLPSVEMASIVADENQPPTVLLSRRYLGGYFQAGKVGVVATRFSGADPPLTDRYGFIYDIQHAGMLKDASIAGAPAPASLNGIISGLEEGQGWIESRRRTSQDTRPEMSRTSTGSTTSTRSSPSIGVYAAVETSSSGTSGRATPTGKRSASKEHIDNRHRSSTVISLNPSPARPVTAKDTLTVSARGASSLRSAISSPIIDPPPTIPDAAVSRATVSSLLNKLTDIHDRQQADRKAEWDSWIRKHRAKNSKKDKGKVEVGGEGAGWGGDMIGISQMGLGDAEEWRASAKLVRRGIPLAYRADIWAEDALVPGEYQEILSVHADDTLPVLADIEKDVSRTFPGNMFFGGDGPGVAKLRRVLVAYSWRNPSVGYCQGMNMLAATLLLTHTDEEQAFWVLSAMLDRLLPKDFYSPSLLASRTDQLVLVDLVALHLPKLSGHLEELGVDLASITFGWFLSLFTDCLPVETLFRVWDVFFVEGHDTLFRVALAILKMNEAEICLTDSAGDLFVFVSGMTSRLWAADKLIALQHSYKAAVKHTDISGRYTRHLASLQEM